MWFVFILSNVYRSGCFEQTSCTVYPLVMALSYLRTSGQTVDPGMLTDINDKLKRGASLALFCVCVEPVECITCIV